MWNTSLHRFYSWFHSQPRKCHLKNDCPHCSSIRYIVIFVPSTVHKLFSITQRSRLSQCACSQKSLLSSPLFYIIKAWWLFLILSEWQEHTKEQNYKYMLSIHAYKLPGLYTTTRENRTRENRQLSVKM